MTNHNADNAAKTRTIKFRGMRIDNNEWVYGNLLLSEPLAGGRIQNAEIHRPFAFDVSTTVFEVIPETVGQLRYTSPKGVEYYDDDVYYHAGHGDETVSDLCELQMALMTGNTEDIGDIKYNIHQHPTHNG